MADAWTIRSDGKRAEWESGSDCCEGCDYAEIEGDACCHIHAVEGAVIELGELLVKGGS